MANVTATRTPRTRRASAPPATPSRSRSKAAPPSHDAIATRAFELFVARGGAHGAHVDDWLRAEAELSPKSP